MKIDEEDIVKFIEDHTVIKAGGIKLIRILPFEWDEFLKKQRSIQQKN